MSDDKTEAPTARRREQARAKGQGVGRSHELSMALTLGAGTIMVMATLPGAATRLGSLIQQAIFEMGSRHIDGTLAADRFGGGFSLVLSITMPIAVGVLIAGIAGQLASGGIVIALGAIKFNGSRMNPMSGLKRLADRQALVRLSIALVKLFLLAAVSWQVVGSRVPSLVGLGGATAGQIAGMAMEAILQLGLTMTILMGGIALVDLIIQRRKATNSMKMSKDEVRREATDQDGDPLFKAMRRRRAKQLAFARMMDAVPTADVIVVNPIRLAIALKYDGGTMKAPTIVAKGQRLTAGRIRDLAMANNVPIIEDVPLARALFTRPIGSEVPAHLFRAVARILVIVHQARAGRRPAAAARPMPADGRASL
jgi:flagellar biosynthetic protein FlhB